MSIVSRSTQQYSGFDPRSIPGCALWLDAADSNTISFSSGSNVSQWRDKSGNANHVTQATLSNNPVYGTYLSKTGINFSGTQNLLTPYTQSGTGGRNTFIVFNDVNTTADTFGNPPLMLMGDPAGLGGSWRTGVVAISNQLCIDIGDGAKAMSASPNPTNMRGTINIAMWAVPNNGNVGNVYLFGNGSQFTTNVTTYNLTRTLNTASTVGTRIGGSNVSANIYEILHYSNELTTTQRQQVEGYLGNKWGLRTNLPTSHPFRPGPVFTRPFLPIDIDGLALWLDAADSSTITTSGSSVTQWNDKSGNGRNVTQTTTSPTDRRPTYSNGVLNFNGSNFLSGTNTFSVLNSGTLFAVARHSSTRGRAIDIRNNTMSLGIEFGTTPDLFFHNSFGQWIQSFTNGTNNLQIMVNTRNGSSAPQYARNGGSLISFTTSQTAAANSGSQYVVGYDPTGTSFMNGIVCEIIYYDSYLTTAQRQQIEGYLAAKWGLSTSLPPAIQAVPSIFDPRTISGCQLWLDAADSSTVTGTTNITALRDKSSNAFVFSNATGFSYNITLFQNQFPSFYRATNATGVNLGSNTSISFTQPMTFFVVCQAVTLGDAYVFDSTTSTNRMAFISYGPSKSQPVLYAGTTIFNTNSNAFATPAIHSGTFNGTSSSLFQNGSLNVTGDIGTQGATGLTIGTRFTNDTCWMGHICEILMYTGILTTSQRQQIEGYLYAKWNIPVTRHPYYRIQSLPTTPIFTPASLSGLSLWLDAADTSTIGFSSGSNVGSWTDKAAGIVSQYSTSIGSVNPPVYGSKINGSNAILFDQTLLPVNVTQNTSTRTYFFVVNIQNGYTNNVGGLIWPTTVVNTYVRGGAISFDNTGTITFANQNVANLLYLQYSQNSPMVLSATFNSGSTGMWNTGGGTTTSTGQSSTAFGSNGSTDNSFTIGGTSGNMTPLVAGYFGKFILGEMLVYNSALTTAQRQQVEGYLAWKWGLRNNLPLNFNRTIQSPLQISNCTLWLDGADPNANGIPPTNGTTITTWKDKSISGINFNGTNVTYSSSSSNLVFNGTNASFSNTTQYMLSNVSNWTIFAVHNSSTTSGGVYQVYRTTGNAFLYRYRYNANGPAEWHIGGNVYIYSTQNNGNGVSCQITETSTTTSGYLNGVLAGSGTRPSVSGLEGAYIGQNSANSEWFNGTISEILFYNRALTTAERKSVEAYLQNKWNVAVPTAHPYKNFRP